MGFSLKKLVKQDLNPFDGPRPASTANAAPPQQFSQVAQQRIMARNPNQGMQQIRRGPVLPGRIAPAEFVQTKALFSSLNDNVVHPFVTRPLAEVAQTGRDVFNGGKSATYHPGSKLERTVFGDTPVDSIQKKVADQYKRQSTSNNQALRIASRPLAAGEAALSIANDTPVVGGLAKGTTKLVSKVAPRSLEAVSALTKEAAPLLKGASKLPGATTRLAKNVIHIPESVAHEHLVATDPYYNTYHDQLTTQKQTFDRNAANGMAPGHPTQVQLQKSMNQLGAKTADMRQAVLDNAKINVGSKLGLRPLDSAGSASGDSPLMPLNKPLANAAEKLQGKSSPKAPVEPTLVPKKIVSSEGSIDKELSKINKQVDALKRNPASYAKDGTPTGEAMAKIEALNGRGRELLATKNAPAPSTKPKPILPTAVVPTRKTLPKVSGEKPVGVSSGNDTPKVVQNSLTRKVSKQNLSPETQGYVSGEHTVRDTANLAEQSAKAADKLPLDTAIERAHGMIATPLGHVDDAQTGFIAKTIENADTAATKARIAGDTVTAERLSRESAALHDGLSEHATARGQANQALIMLYNQSPQGMLYRALKDLGRAGVKDSPELRAKLQPLSDAIKTAANQEERMNAIANFHQVVSKQMPQNIGDKLIGVWKAGLLSGVKTQQGNAISNALFGAMKKISDVPATGADMFMTGIGKGLKKIGLVDKESQAVGFRQKTLSGKGIASGTQSGGKNAWYTLKTGIDRRSAGDKYEQHAEINFSHAVLDKTVGKAVRGIFRGMNAADQPFWYAAFKNSMYDQAKADGINLGLKGDALAAHMDKMVAEPTPRMANTALTEANKSTLNYDTLASKAVQAVHTGIDKVQSLNGRPVPAQTRAFAHGVINVLAPFVRVPTAFLSRTVDFTPLGVGKEVFNQIATKQFDQRALSQAIGEGLTGTGAIAMGVALTQHKMLSGDYPKNDPKEQQRWKAEGITPNSVKLGSKWISLNYMGPLGLLFNAGNKLEEAKTEGKAAQVGQAIAGFGQGLMGQSFLQGFSGFSDAINDPTRNLQKFVNSQVASIVPNISGDIANLTDSMQRQADNVGGAIANKIPGLRQKNPVKQDVYGNALKQPGGRFGTVVGWKPSNSLTNSNPVINEVSRLHNVDSKNADLQVTPTQVGKSVTVNGTDIPINDKQRYDLQKRVGQATQKRWGDLIQTPEYKAMTDTEKAAALNNIRSLATEHATRAFVVNSNLATYNKPESKKAVALANGDKTVAEAAASKSTGGSSSTTTKDYYKAPDAEYKALQTSYNDKAKAGWNSPAQKIQADKELAKAKVGSSYDKPIRDLYNAQLTDADVYNYVQGDKNGQAIVDKLLAYGDALKEAGVTTKNKFRDKYGNVTLGKSTTAKTKGTGTKKSSGGSRARGTSNTAFAANLKAYNSAASQNQKALLNLVKGAKISSSRSKKLNVTKVALKKQTANRQKAKVA